jgi:hypothetical protein
MSSSAQQPNPSSLLPLMPPASSSSLTTTTTTTTTTGGDDGATNNAVVGGEDTSIHSHDPNRWFFDKAIIDNSPSRKAGVDPDKELAYRQQAANFIQDIGQRLQV